MEEAKEELKKIAKMLFKIVRRILKPILILIIPIIILLASFMYFLTTDDAKYKKDDWSSTPYAAETYIQEVTVDDDGLWVYKAIKIAE